MHVNQSDFNNVMSQQQQQQLNDHYTDNLAHNHQQYNNNNNNTANNLTSIVTNMDHSQNNNNNSENSYDVFDSVKDDETISVADETALLDLSYEEVKNLVRAQLEFYFSRENLMYDKYLSLQMDSDNYVLISTLATFNRIKKYKPTIKLICDAVEESPLLQLDSTATKIRAACKRCVIILRDVAENTTNEEVIKLFEDEKCPKCQNCEYAGNRSWYVTFKHEEDAQKAFQYLKEFVQIFQGKPIFARIKAHPIPRSSVSTTPLNAVNKLQSIQTGEVLIQNPTNIINATVLQQATTTPTIPQTQIYTANSIDTSATSTITQSQISHLQPQQIQMQQLPPQATSQGQPTINGNLTQIPLATHPGQFHPRMQTYPQPATIYSINQPNIQYIQQYVPWHSVFNVANMQPIDQLSIQNNRPYQNVTTSPTTNVNSVTPPTTSTTTLNTINNNTNNTTNNNNTNNNNQLNTQNNNTANTNNSTNNSIGLNINAINNITNVATSSTTTTANTSINTNTNVPINQNRNPRQIHNRPNWSHNRNNRNNISNKNIARYNNYYSNQQMQQNDNYQNSYNNSNNNNDEKINNYEYKQAPQLNDYQPYRQNTYHNNEIRRFNNRRNINRQQYHNNNNNNSSSNNNQNNDSNQLITNTSKHYSNSRSNRNYQNNNTNINDRLNINTNQNYENIYNNNSGNNKLNTTPTATINSTTTATTITTTVQSTTTNNSNKTNFDYEPTSFPPLNNNSIHNHNNNEKQLIDNNNNNINNNKDNSDNVIVNNNLDNNNNNNKSNDTDNKTSNNELVQTPISPLSTASSTINIPVQNNDHINSNTNINNKKALVSPLKQVPQQQQQQQQSNKTITVTNQTNVKKSSPTTLTQIKSDDSDRRPTFAQIVQQTSTKSLDENSNELNSLASPSASLIQSNNSSGDEQDNKYQNDQTRITNGYSKKTKANDNNTKRLSNDTGRQQRNDDENRLNKVQQKNRNQQSLSSTTTTTTTTNGVTRVNSTSKKHQNSTDNKIKTNMQNAVIA